MPTFYARLVAWNPDEPFVLSGVSLTGPEAMAAKGELITHVTGIVYPPATPPYYSLDAAITGPVVSSNSDVVQYEQGGRQHFGAVQNENLFVEYDKEILGAPASLIIEYTAPVEMGFTTSSSLLLIYTLTESQAMVTFGTASGFVQVSAFRVWRESSAFWTDFVLTSEEI